MAHDAEARRKAMAAVNDIFDRYILLLKQRPEGRKYFDEDIMHDLRLIDASPAGTVTYELTLTPTYSNLNDVMHGGAAGVIFDMCTTTALAPLVHRNNNGNDFYFFLGGVTRTLSISYLRAIPLDTTVRIHSWVVGGRAGRTMAFIRGEMTSVDGGVVYCTAEHHKVNVPARSAHLAVQTDWDRETGRVVGGAVKTKGEYVEKEEKGKL